MSKEILILTPIGRIKWLKAPDSLSEILYHLSKTFRVHEMCITLIDSTSSTISPESYAFSLLFDKELIYNFSFDETLNRLLESAPPEKKDSFKTLESTSKVPRDERPIRPRAPEQSRAYDPEPKGIDHPLIDLSSNPKAWVDEPKVLTRKASKVGAGRNKRGANKTEAEDPKMTEGLKTLRDFGFTDTNKCKLALTKANFDIEQAIEELLK